MNGANIFFRKVFILLLFYNVFGGMGTAGLWRFDAATELSNLAHQHHMSPESDGLDVGYPAPVVRRTGIKLCYVCVPRRPHTTTVQLEAC